MMLDRRLLIGLAALPLVAASAQASANYGKPYTAQTLAEAQKAGKSILVVVHAPWCPTCKTQDPILRKLLAETKYQKIAVFVVDFDSQKDALRALNAPKQSTLIGYKGTKETGRSSGDTNPLTIEDLVEGTL